MIILEVETKSGIIAKYWDISKIIFEYDFTTLVISGFNNIENMMQRKQPLIEKVIDISAINDPLRQESFTNAVKNMANNGKLPIAIGKELYEILVSTLPDWINSQIVN